MEAELESKLGEQQRMRQQLATTIPPPIKFKTAFQELVNKHTLLNCGIEKIDSLLNLTLGDRLAITGNRKYTQMLVTRLCVNALLLLLSSSKKRMNNREADIFTSNVIVVDAGNSTDFYQYVNFARQYHRRDVIDRVLNNIIISRVFTIYQLADIVINVLPKVIEQYDAKMVVVSDLLDMFICDPQIEVKEARYLINEIVSSITTKSRALEDVLVVVSLPSVASSAYNHNHHHHHNDKPSKLYNNKMVLPRFSECIEITNSRNNKNKMIDVKIRNNSCSNVRRNKKNTTNDLHELFFSIKERDLLTLEPQSN